MRTPILALCFAILCPAGAAMASHVDSATFALNTFDSTYAPSDSFPCDTRDSSFVDAGFLPFDTRTLVAWTDSPLFGLNTDFGGPVVLDEWLAARGVPESLRSPLDDAGCGFPNLVAYFHNIDPTRPPSASERSALPTAALGRVDGSDVFVFRFRGNANALHVNVSIQQSTTLMVDSWSEVPEHLIYTGDFDFETGNQFFEVRLPIDSLSTTFMRLVLSPTDESL